jgi:cytochrome c oxidase subunit 2
MALEILWSVIPFGITMVMFTWGASLYFKESRPPDNALPIYVVGKQWMWKIEHMEGQREINELHIPVNRAVRLTMTSEDVIHSFFVPAFRTKEDVVPGKLFHLLVHGHQAGQISPVLRRVLRQPALRHDRVDLRDGAARITRTGSTAVRRRRRWRRAAKSSSRTWPAPTATSRRQSGRCPSCWGSSAGRCNWPAAKVVADEGYIRESILQPQAKIVAGYQPVMPTFQGLVTEDGIVHWWNTSSRWARRRTIRKPSAGTLGEIQRRGHSRQ